MADLLAARGADSVATTAPDTLSALVKYRVAGVILETGDDAAFVAEAVDEDGARKLGKDRGMFVRTVEPVAEDAVATGVVQIADPEGEWWMTYGLIVLMVLFVGAAILQLLDSTDSGELAVGLLPLVAAMLCGVIVALIRLARLVRQLCRERS